MGSLSFSQSKTNNILIVYGSFSGSTKEIVDSMKTYLMNDYTSVDILLAEKRKIELSKYDMIIIGSAIHGNTPYPQILEFIDVNRDELKSKKKCCICCLWNNNVNKEKKT